MGCGSGSTKETSEKNKEDLILKTDAFEITDFIGINNLANGAGEVPEIDIDYTDAINGIEIPSSRQTQAGTFRIKFSVSGAKEPLFYKIYYQNESYKFSEDSVVMDPLAEENFYGSWPTLGGFKPIGNDLNGEKISVNDELKIVGNPRNEERYISQGVNNRWQRNPRVGTYSFLLVVVSASELKNIPAAVQDITLIENGHYHNPYHFFKSGNGRKLKNASAIQLEALKVKASLALGSGIYVDPKLISHNPDSSLYAAQCGGNNKLYQSACFEQLFQSIVLDANVPEIRDVIGSNYSKRDYNWNKHFYQKEEMVTFVPTIPRRPCETVSSDPVNNKITFWNPASKDCDYKKENSGIRARHGMTYGKYTMKVKMTELINKNDIWNGVTNALWLITQSLDKWNWRRSCTKEGYLANYLGGDTDYRQSEIGYSEIDFEILKTPPYCPRNAFPPVYKRTKANKKSIGDWDPDMPQEIIDQNGLIAVSCTNWDMACPQPKNFGVGCHSTKYGEFEFLNHRWSNLYRAVTSKTPANDDELFAGPYYYFQIDWQPNEIIWRIGPSKDKMRVVGYMDRNMTSIPNNQMLLIIDQEWHDSNWWVGSAYSQENVPFPAKDLKAEILEVTIE